MSYQSVGTPRFYIDIFQHLKDNGYEPIPTGGAFRKNILGLDPVYATQMTTAFGVVWDRIDTGGETGEGVQIENVNEHSIGIVFLNNIGLSVFNFFKFS